MMVRKMRRTSHGLYVGDSQVGGGWCQPFARDVFFAGHQCGGILMILEVQ